MKTNAFIVDSLERIKSLKRLVDLKVTDKDLANVAVSPNSRNKVDSLCMMHRNLFDLNKNLQSIKKHITSTGYDTFSKSIKSL